MCGDVHAQIHALTVPDTVLARREAPFVDACRRLVRSDKISNVAKASPRLQVFRAHSISNEGAINKYSAAGHGAPSASRGRSSITMRGS